MSQPVPTVVVKFGGSAFSASALKPFGERLRRLHDQGCRIVVVHGGGKEITGLLERLGKTSVFVDGLRVTDAETLDATEMVLSGRVNKAIVRGLAAAGVPSAGIAGTDAATLVARPLRSPVGTGPAVVQHVDYGLVGEVAAVDPALLRTLLDAGYTPVLSPLATTEDDGILNVNADTVAAKVAGALHADAFLLLTDVEGVLVPDGDAKRLASHLTTLQVERLKTTAVITGGMIPKVDACIDALQAGAKSARILSLANFLALDEPPGTTITEA